MKKFLGAIVVTIAMILAIIGVTPPAHAGTCTGGIVCGQIRHYSPDTGLDGPIKIRCDFGDPDTNHNLYEGENSPKYCKDTDQVYVGSGQEIWCKYYPGIWVNPQDSNGIKLDSTGWHKINDIWDDGEGCTVRSD